MTIPIVKAVRLNCHSQNYEWGKIGNESKVAKFSSNATKGFKMDNDRKYAELWMGTHPNGPSSLYESPDLLMLEDFIAQDKATYLGTKTLQKYNNLPFLFKVLSIRTALSIQAHPDKKLAKELHEKYPKIYKDANHKPEMAIALTTFECLCGFRPVQELKKYLVDVSELSNVLDERAVAEFLESKHDDENESKKLLKALFASLMKCEAGRVKDQLESLKKREGDEIFQLVRRLATQYPGDVGVFCVFFLNYIVMQAGDALFMGANEPHAYISGASDNVVRAGLTPKLRDVPTLVEMLTYECKDSKRQLLKPKAISPNEMLYNPPIEEFAVVKLLLNQNEKRVFNGWEGPSILIVTQGSGTLNADNSLDEGAVYFLPSGVEFTIQADSSITIYVAISNKN